jgi:radical SAM protein with 4Fe4S-binding SPASM domain
MAADSSLPLRLPAALATREGWVRLLELKRSPDPHLHQIEPTNACPFTCAACIRPTRMTRPIGYMDFDLYRKVIDEVATFDEATRAKEIELFHFGESLLHPRLPEMVALASGAGLKPVLSVNPPVLNPALAEALLAARPARIVCSLDGDDAETYRLQRGPAANFDLAVARIEGLLDARRRLGSDVPVVVRMILTHAVAGQEGSFAARWRAAGAEVELRPFFPWNDDSLVPLGDWERLPPGMPCPFAWRYLVVQWNGDVVPCCRDCNAEIVLGNVATESLRSIWNGPRYRAFREEMATGAFTNGICAPCLKLYGAEHA